MKDKKSKKNLIIGCSVGAVVVVAVVILLVVLLGGGGDKTVSCVMNKKVSGIDTESKVNVKVTSGKVLGGDMTTKVDLTNMSDFYKKNESTLVEGITESFQKQCDDDCTFDHSYTEGDNLTVTMKFGETGVSSIVHTYGIEGKSAQEIADKVQQALEDSDTTCERR